MLSTFVIKARESSKYRSKFRLDYNFCSFKIAASSGSVITDMYVPTRDFFIKMNFNSFLKKLSLFFIHFSYSSTSGKSFALVFNIY